MTEKRDDKEVVAIEVGTNGARISGKGLMGIGRAAEWLFPERSARARLDDAMARRIADKLARGEFAFDETEKFYLQRWYEKDLKRHARAERVLERAREVFPDVENQMAKLPPAPSDTTEEWTARFLRDAEDISDEQLRDLYARILAGELVRPGSYSLKTLTVLRDLSRETASLFERIHGLIFNEDSIPRDWATTHLEERGVSFDNLLSLMEAGLLQYGTNLAVYPPVKRVAQDACEARVTHADRMLVVQSAEEAGSLIGGVPVWGLTRAGRELATIPTSPFDDAYFREVAEQLSIYIGSPRPSTVRWCMRDDPDALFDFDPELRPL